VGRSEFERVRNHGKPPSTRFWIVAPIILVRNSTFAFARGLESYISPSHVFQGREGRGREA